VQKSVPQTPEEAEKNQIKELLSIKRKKVAGLTASVDTSTLNVKKRKKKVVTDGKSSYYFFFNVYYIIYKIFLHRRQEVGFVV
jgi:hypothetical protein